MRRVIVLLCLSVLAVTAAALTQELYYDNGVKGGAILFPHLRATWFTMPFDGWIITARMYLADEAGYSSPFDVTFCPRDYDTGGWPDESGAYGTYEYAGGEAAGEGWIDVDVNSLGIELEAGTEFYCIFDPRPAGGLPYGCHDSRPDDPYDRKCWRADGGDWQSSGLPAYMMRVVVWDGIGEPVELTSWGDIKVLAD